MVTKKMTALKESIKQQVLTIQRSGGGRIRVDMCDCLDKPRPNSRASQGRASPANTGQWLQTNPRHFQQTNPYTVNNDMAVWEGRQRRRDVEEEEEEEEDDEGTIEIID